MLQYSSSYTNYSRKIRKFVQIWEHRQRNEVVPLFLFLTLKKFTGMLYVVFQVNFEGFFLYSSEKDFWFENN